MRCSQSRWKSFTVWFLVLQFLTFRHLYQLKEFPFCCHFVKYFVVNWYWIFGPTNTASPFYTGQNPPRERRSPPIGWVSLSASAPEGVFPGRFQSLPSWYSALIITCTVHVVRYKGQSLTSLYIKICLPVSALTFISVGRIKNLAKSNMWEERCVWLTLQVTALWWRKAEAGPRAATHLTCKSGRETNAPQC